MATDKQNQANAANSLLSSGPKTDEGKDMSKRNALKSGLTGLGIVRPEHMENEILETIDWIWPHYKPRDHLEERFVKHIAVQLVLVDEANRLQVAQRLRVALRAEVSWDEDREALAAEWFEELAKKPVAGLRRLRGSMHGCTLLTEHWRALDAILDRNGGWDEEQRSLALDMLGVSRAVRQGGTVLEVPEGVEARTHLRGVVRAELTRLAARCEELKIVNEADRELALQGHDPHDQETRKLRRYGGEALNKIIRLQREFARVDRKGLPWVPPQVPKRYQDEPDADYQGRLDAYRAEIRLHDERKRQEANATRLATIDEETRALLEEQPKFHEGLDFVTYFDRLKTWHAKRTGKPVDVVLAPEEGLIRHDAALSAALPPEIESTPEFEWTETTEPGETSATVAPQPAYDRQDR